MTDEDQDLKRVQKCLDELGEHYDSVQVFCTRHEQGQSKGTIRVGLGTGNWYARYGQVKEWIVREEEYARITARNDDE